MTKTALALAGLLSAASCGGGSFDVEALQAVYGSSINIDARRADFVAAGLIRS